MPILTCKGCDHEFYAARSGRKYCGQACYQKNRATGTVKAMKRRDCANCGMQFLGTGAPPGGAYRFYSAAQMAIWQTVCSAKCFHEQAKARELYR